jgi:hypothetical protein
MKLSKEEQGILDGRQGPILQKVMRTLVTYGQVLGAERFVEIEGEGHFAIPSATPGVGPRLEMLDELVEAGLRTKYPFTLDPRPPLDFENLGLTPEQEQTFEQIYRNQVRYDERMLQLGLRDTEAYERLAYEGVKLSTTCPEAYIENRLCASEAVITNSNKLRAFTPARFLLDEVWAEKRICTIDQLGDRFLESVEEGQRIEIREDGTVIVG